MALQRVPSVITTCSLRWGMRRPAFWSARRPRKISSRVELDRRRETLQLVLLPLAVRQLGLGALVDGARDQDLAGAGGRLRAGGGVDDRADRGQVAMRPAEFPEGELSGMDADPDAERVAVMPWHLSENLTP